MLENMKITKIKRFLKAKIKKSGQPIRVRNQRQLMCSGTLSLLLTYNTIKRRASSKLQVFLTAYSQSCLFKIKVQRYFSRICSLQRKIRSFRQQ